jgi:hypothetical protein
MEVSDYLSYTQQFKISTYCIPTKLAVNNAMRIDSEEPLIDGSPLHSHPALEAPDGALVIIAIVSLMVISINTPA